MDTTRPMTRIEGGTPTFRKRSDASSLTIAAKMLASSMGCPPSRLILPYFGGGTRAHKSRPERNVLGGEGLGEDFGLRGIEFFQDPAGQRGEAGARRRGDLQHGAARLLLHGLLQRRERLLVFHRVHLRRDHDLRLLGERR